MEKKKEVIKEDLKPRCLKCNSSFVYIRIRDHQKVCRSCGYIEDILEDKK